MIFCIGQEKSEKLSNYLSHIINIIKQDNRITAVAMNSYLIHIPVYPVFKYPNLIDGLNIKLTLVCDDEIEYVNSSVDIIKSQVLKELNYNITLDIVSNSFIKENLDKLKNFLVDTNIIFDRKGDLTNTKNYYFCYDKNYETVEYQPRLKIGEKYV